MSDTVRELIDGAVPPETELVIRLEELSAELDRQADEMLEISSRLGGDILARVMEILGDAPES